MDGHVQIFWEIQHVYACKLTKNASEKQDKSKNIPLTSTWQP